MNSKSTKEKTIAICFPNNEIKEYDYDNLREEIIRGNVKKDYKTRLISISAKGSDKSKETEWSTLEKISNTDFKLQTLYKPVWAHTMKGLFYGASAGMIIFCLWGMIQLHTVNQGASFFGFFLVAMLAKGIISSKGNVLQLLATVAGYFFISLLLMLLEWATIIIPIFSGSMVGGFLLGGSAGMILGTAVGHLRVTKLPKAPDVGFEGGRPYIIGLLAPIIVSVVLALSYVYWILPWATKVLSR